jgi:zinc and cadmium transporter
MSPELALAAFALLPLAASLAGGLVPAWARISHARMQLMMSLVAGLMLGVGAFLMLPHAAHETGSIDQAVLWLMAGLLVMFFLQRFFHFHQHESAVTEGTGGDDTCPDGPHAHGPLGPGLADDPRPPAAAHLHGQHLVAGRRRLSWVGVAVGLVVHSLLDGVALAAALKAGGGLAVFLAVVLHKPLDAMAIGALMLAGGWSAPARHAVNMLYALVCPAGLLLFHLGVAETSGASHAVVGAALGFSAGVFLCISLGDLLPELQFHAHDRVKLSVALLCGVAVAYALARFEASSHAHQHGHDAGHPHGEEAAGGGHEH